MNLKNLFRKNKYVTEKVVYGNSTGKYSITRGCTVEISSKSEAKRKEIENQLKPLVKKYVENPQKLLQYLKFKGVKIYQINNAGKILSFFGEEEGFISKQTGIKSCILGIVLSIITEKKFNIAFSNSEMLIFDSKSCDIYIIARAIHKYYSSKNNLPGYDKKSQNIFKKLYGKRNEKYADGLIQNTSLKDIIACKSALERDLESINFALELSTEHERSKKVLKQITNQENVKI